MATSNRHRFGQIDRQAPAGCCSRLLRRGLGGLILLGELPEGAVENPHVQAHGIRQISHIFRVLMPE
jgi:hypothetical protein